MSGNSTGNSDPREKFWDLFLHHWNSGTGLDKKRREQDGHWTYRTFADAMQKAGVKNLDKKTVDSWLAGEQWPQGERKEAILAVFFPHTGGDPVARQAMEQAWQEGRLVSRAAAPATRRAFEDLDPPRWDRLESWGTPRLAEHGMADPTPQGNSDNGVYRIAGQPIVSIVEGEFEGRYVRVGVNNVQVLLESAAYDIQPNSRISEREKDNPLVRTVAGGVRVHAADASSSLDGPLWAYGDVLLVQNNGEPD
jgi:hypothetical protein